MDSSKPKAASPELQSGRNSALASAADSAGFWFLNSELSGIR